MSRCFFLKVLVFAQMDSNYHNEDATDLKVSLSLENAIPGGFKISLVRAEDIWRKTGKWTKVGLEKCIHFLTFCAIVRVRNVCNARGDSHMHAKDALPLLFSFSMSLRAISSASFLEVMVWEPPSSSGCPSQCGRISMDVVFDDSSATDNYGNQLTTTNPCPSDDMAHNSFFCLTIRAAPRRAEK